MDLSHRRSRRDFLRYATTATLTAGATTLWAGSAAASPQPTGGWHGPHIPKSRIGIQLYSLRNLMSESVEDTLAFLANVGYKEVELAGLHGYGAKKAAALLNELGLQAPSSHAGIPPEADAQEEIFEQARILGQRWVTLAWFNSDNLQDWYKLAERLNDAGERAQRHGLRVAYHNHDQEFGRIDGKRPFDVLLAETDRRVVDFELDIYWALAGKVDPVDLFRQAPRRFPLTHVKGMAADGSFADVGEGIVDWAKILSHRDLAGFRHHFVERDDLPHPKQTARDSFSYLSQLTLERGRGHGRPPGAPGPSPWADQH